jgi:DNA-binding beta-propeller fold protein YncE
LEQLPITAAEDVTQAINSIGRTEDVHFSPSNARLAVAGFTKNSILVLTVRRLSNEVIIESALTIGCPDFSFPHGVFWLSERRLVVANRGGDVTFIDVPDQRNTGMAEVSAILTLRSDNIDLLRAPGSVSGFPVGENLLELLVCNNSGHYVTRHLLKADEELIVLGSQIAVRDGLSVPDGVTYDKARRWAAVSNHDHHTVHIYRVADFGHFDCPAAVLRGMSYPHGLRFSATGQFLFVADAGDRFVQVFKRPGPDWTGEVAPSEAIQVVDEETFLRGRENEQEGGPKGVDLSSDGSILVCSCHQQPLAFFQVDSLLRSLGEIVSTDTPAARQPAEQVLMDWVQSSRGEHSALHDRLARAESQVANAQAVLSSTSWRVTAPLRAVMRLMRR